MEEAPHETPSQIVSAQDTASHSDAKGRVISVKRLNALQFYRLTKVMGASSSNAAAMDMAMIASSVRKIDATPVAMPTTEREVEFLIQQLDFDGIAGAAEALGKLVAKDDEAIEAAKN
jgi:hypothetical protein